MRPGEAWRGASGGVRFVIGEGRKTLDERRHPTLEVRPETLRERFPQLMEAGALLPLAEDQDATHVVWQAEGVGAWRWTPRKLWDLWARTAVRVTEAR